MKVVLWTLLGVFVAKDVLASGLGDSNVVPKMWNRGYNTPVQEYNQYQEPQRPSYAPEPQRPSYAPQVSMQASEEGGCKRDCACSMVRGPPGPMGGSRPGPAGLAGPKGVKGVAGDPGCKGESSQPGTPGRDGMRGARGRPGTPGQPGGPGMPGPQGPRGNPGPDGAQGKQGSQGPKGYDGTDGQPGCNGPNGQKGQPGRDGPTGYAGDKGDPGSQGPPGPIGPPGPTGDMGLPGISGEDARGRPGPKGTRGNQGQQGITGMTGEPGDSGDRGCEGSPGRPGMPGPKGPRGMRQESNQQCLQNFIYARHSQNTDTPLCGEHEVLWNGWSLLHTEDEARSFVQDLGRASSCMKEFEPMPFMFCGSNEVCTWGARTATSYWLASDTRQQYIGLFGLNDSRERPITDVNDIKRQISRCSVCQACGPVMAFHSMNTSTPSCPRNWNEQWTGYSLAMHSVGPMGGGQPLESPGSCMREFRHHPYIECTSTGQCAYYSEKMSYWLAGLDQMPTDTIDPSRLSVVKKREEAMPNIGRCVVCALEMTARGTSQNFPQRQQPQVGMSNPW